MNHPHTNLHKSRYVTNKKDGDERKAFIKRMAERLYHAEQEQKRLGIKARRVEQ